MIARVTTRGLEVNGAGLFRVYVFYLQSGTGVTKVIFSKHDARVFLEGLNTMARRAAVDISELPEHL